MRKIGRLQTSFRSQAISVLRPSWLACAVGADGSVDESVEIDSNSASIRWHPHWRSWRLCWRGMWRHAAAAAATCYFTTWPMMWRRNVPLSSAALTRRRQVVRHNFVIIIALFLSSVVSRTVHTHTHTHTIHLCSHPSSAHMPPRSWLATSSRSAVFSFLITRRETQRGLKPLTTTVMVYIVVKVIGPKRSAGNPTAPVWAPLAVTWAPNVHENIGLHLYSP